METQTYRVCRPELFGKPGIVVQAANPEEAVTQIYASPGNSGFFQVYFGEIRERLEVQINGEWFKTHFGGHVVTQPYRDTGPLPVSLVSPEQVWRTSDGSVYPSEAMAAARQAVLYLRSKLPLGATEALLKDPVLYAELLTKIVEGRQNVPRQ